ncbi:unnamed protein product [Brugia timori]|uniref:Cyclic nucleotide-binding domain-containing protein n=1 Tax=Brugia timori TaxID=42155 RepID=A0A3P7SVT7_9BILA|nr:unnamed protein product [Brugia timori]
MIEALEGQKLVAGNQELAKFLASKVQLRAVATGESVIKQGDSDNFVLLILAGLFDIVVNGRRVARRTIGDHVGEMAAIDSAQPRAATVTAAEPGLVAMISEAHLAEAGQNFPHVYKVIAKELARRLHQRNAHVGSAREKIKLFVISSKESMGVARAIQNALQYDDFVTTVWTDGVFRAGSSALQSLLDAVDDSDFAVAIAHADDMTNFRGTEWPAPRDNVVFELGLFMGRLGKERAILMEPRERDVKLPSDLAGVTTITYRYEKSADAAALMAPACNDLRAHILRLGPNL